jgi:DNA-directed RNA polymerase subunit M
MEQSEALCCSNCGYQIEATDVSPHVKRVNKAVLEKKIAQNKTLVVDRAKELEKIAADSNVMCYRCKSHKIEYVELQTRRADEPMTRFFRCANCGNRWRG